MFIRGGVGAGVGRNFWKQPWGARKTPTSFPAPKVCGECENKIETRFEEEFSDPIGYEA